MYDNDSNEFNHSELYIKGYVSKYLHSDLKLTILKKGWKLSDLIFKICSFFTILEKSYKTSE